MTLTSTVQAPFLEHLGADGGSRNAYRLSKLQYLLYVQPATARFRMKVQVLCTRLRHRHNQEAGMRRYTVPSQQTLVHASSMDSPAELMPSFWIPCTIWWYTLNMLQLQDDWPLLPWPQFVAQ